jgi:hypothetical protein
MIDPQLSQLAAQILEVLKPLAAGAAGGFIAKPGQDVFDWLKARLSGSPAGTALGQAVEKPDSDLRWKALEAQLLVVLEENAALRDELRSRLPAPTQSATTTGDRNTVIQSVGSKIKIG